MPVRIQGGPPRWFLLDTGSNLSIVTPGLAAELGLARVNSHGLFAGGKPIEQATVLPRLQLGEMVVEDLFAVVAELPGLSSGTGVEVSGLLGAPVFKDQTLTLDYPDRQVTVSATPFELQQGDITLPLALESLRPAVEVLLGGKPVRALVDTGFSGAVQVPEEAGIAFRVAPVVTGRRYGLAGLTEDRTGSPLCQGSCRLELRRISRGAMSRR
jgi:predicted aspartyl protease